MISTQTIMLIQQAVSNCALENNWNKEKEDQMVDQTISYLLGLDK